MTNTKFIYLVIGSLGLITVLWLSFALTMPVAFYFIGVPLILMPSLLVITQGLSTEKSAKIFKG